jgi:hypothetical protein
MMRWEDGKRGRGEEGKTYAESKNSRDRITGYSFKIQHPKFKIIPWPLEG